MSVDRRRTDRGTDWIAWGIGLYVLAAPLLGEYAWGPLFPAMILLPPLLGIAAVALDRSPPPVPPARARRRR